MKTRIKYVIAGFLTILVIHCYCQDGWQFAKQIGGKGSDDGSVYMDLASNIYCGGIFTGNCYFDHDTLYAGNSTSTGCFLAKYDAAGNEIWVKQIGGITPYDAYEYCGIAAIDKNNNCLYFTGSFQGRLTIDTSTIYSSGGFDIFLAKYDLSGNCLWLKKVSSPSDDGPDGLQLDNNGNIYWTGRLGGSGILDTINLSAGVFLAKLDQSGNIIYARNEMTGGYLTKLKILNNNILITGVSTNKVITLDTDTLSSTKYFGILLAKIDLTGNVIKAVKFESSGESAGTGLEIDPENNIYLIGCFEDSLNIRGNIMVSNNKYMDMTFCKFDSSFTLKWFRQSHNTGDHGTYLADIVFDPEGKLYVTGFFSGNATFGDYNVTSTSISDMILARYDTSGTCLGLKYFGLANGGRLSLYDDGSPLVSGSFWSMVNIGNTTLTSYGDYDMFFAKSDPITGIEGKKQTFSDQLIIYSNPTTGKCNISIPDDFRHEKNLILQILDNIGKVIQIIPVVMDQDKISFNISAEAKGMYNAILSNGKKRYSGKIIFE